MKLFIDKSRIIDHFYSVYDRSTKVYESIKILFFYLIVSTFNFFNLFSFKLYVGLKPFFLTVALKQFSDCAMDSLEKKHIWNAPACIFSFFKLQT